MFFSHLHKHKVQNAQCHSLPVLLHDGAARSVILREACRLRVLENNMLLKEL